MLPPMQSLINFITTGFSVKECTFAADYTGFILIIQLLSMGKSAFRTHISLFFLGEYFSDAVRNTLSVVLPITLFFYLGKPEAATGIGIGALLISLTDLPDHRANKIKAAIYSIALFFLSSLIMALSLNYSYVSAAILISFAFLFSMFTAFGTRMGLIGTMCLALCTFIIGVSPMHPFMFSVYVLLGGCWYYALSLIQILLRPYRPLHHAIFECLISSAAFLRSRAMHYDPEIPLQSLQSSSIRLHIRVNQRHELIRQLLLTDNRAMHPENKKGRILLKRAGLIIDLYEQLSAVHYDYQFVRTVLPKETLEVIGLLINCLANELEVISSDFRKKNSAGHYAMPEYDALETKLADFSSALSAVQQNVVTRISANTNAIAKLITSMRDNFEPGEGKFAPLQEDIAYPLFVAQEDAPIGRQFSLASPVFRFSLRLALSFLSAYVLLAFFAPSRYSYWVFLTLLIVARPRFSLTWKRNVQRILGTLPGIALGLVIVSLVKQPVILLSLSVVFLLGFYAFNRLNYGVCVAFITAAVILTLGSYHGQFDHIIQERIIYTLLGCCIAILASYLFPVWDSRKLESYIAKTARAAVHYLNVAVARASRLTVDPTTGRMARKNAHLSLVELSDAIGSARLEPVGGSIDFASLNAIQFSIYQIIALTTSIYLSKEEPRAYPQLQEVNTMLEQIALTATNKQQLIQSYAVHDDNINADGVSSVDHKLDEILKLSDILLSHLSKFRK